jgi:hypothetical protein
MRRTITLISVFALMMSMLALPAAVADDLGTLQAAETCPDGVEGWVKINASSGTASGDWGHFSYAGDPGVLTYNVNDGGVLELCYKSGEQVNSGNAVYTGPLTGPTSGTINIPQEYSHVSWRASYEPPFVPAGAVTVSKTVVPTFTRTHDWSIEKSVDPEKLYLYVPGQDGKPSSGTAYWDIDVDYEGYTDSGWNLSGVITVANTGNIPARITSVLDQLQTLDYTNAPPVDVEDYTPALVCPSPLPTLAPGESFTCTYSQDLPSNLSGRNKAAAFGQYLYPGDTVYGNIIGATSGMVPFEFGDVPSTEIDKTVDVYDQPDGGTRTLLGQLTAPNGGSFDYNQTFSHGDYAECGDYFYGNRARVVGTESRTIIDTARAELDVHVQCMVEFWKGETATGEGAPTGQAWFMYNTKQELLDGVTILAGQYYDIGTAQLVDGEIEIRLEGARFADVSENVKVHATNTAKFPIPGRYNTKATAPAGATAFDLPVTNTTYYAIHLDVERFAGMIPDPNFGPQ